MVETGTASVGSDGEKSSPMSLGSHNSSFMFDHPEGNPRSHLGIKSLHAKVGNTAILKDLMKSAPETVEKKPSETMASRSHEPVDKPLAQQKLPSYQFVLTSQKVVAGIMFSGVLVLLLGILSLLMSRSVSQIRIHYAGDFESWPAGTRDEETYKRSCTPGNVCTFTVTPSEDMEPPIWIYYALDPFYQNYNSYVQSVAEHFIDKTVIPSLFLDSYSFFPSVGADISGIAWASDLDRFSCSDDVPASSTESRCVRDVVWTRPSALPRVVKPIMKLGKIIKKGEDLAVTVIANTDMQPFGARKELILTTLNSLGGRDDALGLFLIICGLVCFVASAAVSAIQKLCPRAAVAINRQE
jgi:hypothetical protein